MNRESYYTAYENLIKSQNRWKKKHLLTFTIYEQRQFKLIELYYISGRPIFKPSTHIESLYFKLKYKKKKEVKKKPWKF